ncbi:hypothetical protein [Rhizobium sp. CFBP 8762]|uniref:hypothetical protein n=1 Tax=Rhizobium sp. CFBP 8762 TaxID=2775279 RepID=UPI001FD26440|nr:hypothetical protein [Rhizobium sp. CFBP 8762]
MFEFTDTALAEQFQIGNSPDLNKLLRLPCLFISEGIREEVCRVGTITSARIANGEIRFEYLIDPDLPPLQNSFLFEHRIRLDMDRHKYNWDWSRNHWAVKDIDLYRFLLQNVNPRRQKPTVFVIPEHETIQAQLLAVMIPFDAGFDPVYAAINQASTNCGLVARRADEIWEAPGIIQDVVSLIDRARVVVCDLSNRNPNVLYEAGIAHTLGREVIIIAQTEHDVPFDLRYLRHIRYLNNSEGLAALTVAIQDRVQTIIGH